MLPDKVLSPMPFGSEWVRDSVAGIKRLVPKHVSNAFRQ